MNRGRVVIRRYIMVAAAAADPDGYNEDVRVVDGVFTATTIAQSVTEARVWRDERGMRSL